MCSSSPSPLWAGEISRYETEGALQSHARCQETEPLLNLRLANYLVPDMSQDGDFTDAPDFQTWVTRSGSPQLVGSSSGLKSRAMMSAS
jgi:hypothetical protein